MSEDNTVTSIEQLDVGGNVAIGWDSVSDLVSKQKLGVYLKLDAGEMCVFSFGSPMAYFAHRVYMLDGEGLRVKDQSGRDMMALAPCELIYRGTKSCVHCDDSDAKVSKKTLRTVCPVKVLYVDDDKKGIYRPKEWLLFEGGPKIWKEQIIPIVNEYGPTSTFRITRRGLGMQTRYEFMPLSRPANAAIIQAFDQLEQIDVLAALRLGIPDEARD